MNMAAPSTIPAGISEEEWKIRCDLAALYRLVAHHRMTDLIYTHISARIPGPEHHFLINSYGVMFHEMRASDLVKIDVDGNILEPEGRSGLHVNAAGFTIHSGRHPHPHLGRHRRLRPGTRPAADQPARAEILRLPRLPWL
jgi:hypothetical protein